MDLSLDWSTTVICFKTDLVNFTVNLLSLGKEAAMLQQNRKGTRHECSVFVSKPSSPSIKNKVRSAGAATRRAASVVWHLAVPLVERWHYHCLLWKLSPVKSAVSPTGRNRREWAKHKMSQWEHQRCVDSGFWEPSCYRLTLWLSFSCSVQCVIFLKNFRSSWCWNLFTTRLIRGSFAPNRAASWCSSCVLPHLQHLLMRFLCDRLSWLLLCVSS